ncbi:MAG: winged helix-turn-helix transcriptional regulator [Candidatus Omnitrophota bacterium]|nr:MAG: winged helix-turn-helix transcriptional regulator [Candidatus Omnitrophota bacterium]
MEVKGSDFGKEVSTMLPLIMREFTRNQHKDIFAKGLLSVPQVVILDFLYERKGCQMNELARLLNFSMSAVTAIVDKMIRLKLIKRQRSSQDRRVVNVMILSKGKEAIKRVREARRDCVNEMFSVLTQKDREEYIRILKKVYINLAHKK